MDVGLVGAGAGCGAPAVTCLIARTPRGQRNWLPCGVRTRTGSFLLQVCNKPTDFGPSDLLLAAVQPPPSSPHSLTLVHPAPTTLLTFTRPSSVTPAEQPCWVPCPGLHG